MLFLPHPLTKQVATFDTIYDGYDLIARARTGTGKTLGESDARRGWCCVTVRALRVSLGCPHRMQVASLHARPSAGSACDGPYTRAVPAGSDHKATRALGCRCVTGHAGMEEPWRKLGGEEMISRGRSIMLTRELLRFRVCMEGLQSDSSRWLSMTESMLSSVLLEGDKLLPLSSFPTCSDTLPSPPALCLPPLSLSPCAFVLDEADQMLEVGFKDDMEEIIRS
eukprot:754896-Hanusia_phi.AAC.1